MKQTAVEWLINELRQLAHDPSTHIGMGDIRITQGMIDELEEQAKEMEKEQIMDAYLRVFEQAKKMEIEQLMLHGVTVRSRYRNHKETYGK